MTNDDNCKTGELRRTSTPKRDIDVHSKGYGEVKAGCDVSNRAGELQSQMPMTAIRVR
jgi:hypothetical protein